MHERLLHYINSQKHNLFLLSILLVALTIRVWGIGFDLPNLYHPDEDAVIMPALTILKTGNLEPSRLEYGSFQIYLLTGVFTAVYLYLARDGLIGEPEQLPIFVRGSYPMTYSYPQFFLAARLVSVFAGVVVVILSYMLVRRLSNQRQALLAAAITAISPMLVDNSHYATPDSLLSLMVIFSLYLVVRVYDNWHIDSVWPYLGAAFACGLATSTKYNGAVLLVPLLLVPLLKAHNLDMWLSVRIIGAPLSFLVGFFAATPYALLKIPLFLKWAGYSLRLYNMPGKALTIPSWQWHLNYLTTSREAPVFILGALGFFISFYYWRKQGVLINIFAVAFILAIISQTNRQTRMWLPLAPIFAAWAALSIDVLSVHIGKRLLSAGIIQKELRYKSLLTKQNTRLFIIALFMTPVFLLSVRAVTSLKAIDVRTTTAQWIEAHVPSGTSVAVDYFPPNIDPAIWPIIRTFRHFDHELAWYQEKGVQYLVFSQSLYSEEQLTASEQSLYENLLADLCPVETIFGPFLSNPGYSMRIYQVPPCPQ